MSGNEKQNFVNNNKMAALPQQAEEDLNNLNNNNEIINNNKNSNSNSNSESKDCVDFAAVRGKNANLNSLINQGKCNGTSTNGGGMNQSSGKYVNNNSNSGNINNSSKKLTSNCVSDSELKIISEVKKLPIFKIHSKKKSLNEMAANETNMSQKSSPVLGLLRDKPKFVKSASIARLLGNTYNTKKFESELHVLNSVNNANNSNNSNSNHNSGNSNSNSNSNQQNRPFAGAERFHKCQEFENDFISNSNSNSNSNECHGGNHGGSNGGGHKMRFNDFYDDKDLSASRAAFRTISRSLGKLLRRRTYSVEISTPDPEYKVSYLGNVLTGWAKGDGCVEKPLNTLWRNHTQNHKPEVMMRLRVCASGLKATTRQHGLTEYWAHRITHCCAPKNYPRVFCWIYRHEGRKMKHEMRCHAVLCSKETTAQQICTILRENLDQALRDFKRDKLSKQNARLSLANAAYDNPSLPRRKILLSVGGNNYRPPLERSKSAPKLMAIEEAIGEEEGEEGEETNVPEMRSCCQKDSLYPAFTLGRRKCRRGHSIRRTGKIENKSCSSQNHETEVTNVTTKETNAQSTSEKLQITTCNRSNGNETSCSHDVSKDVDENVSKSITQSVSSLSSDEDDLDKVLISHDYDTSSPLADELLSYFDEKLKPDAAQSLSDLDETSILFDPKLSSETIGRRPALSLDNLDSLSDCPDEDDRVGGHYDYDDGDEMFYQQSEILKFLHRNSLNKMAEFRLECENDHNEEGKMNENPQNTQNSVMNMKPPHPLFDSDEGSISSGCETASTVTANMDDTSLKYIHSQQPSISSEDAKPTTSSTTTTFSSAEDDTIKISTMSMHFKLPQVRHIHGTHLNRPSDNGDVSDSEFSDESGYVEFAEQHQVPRGKGVVV